MKKVISVLLSIIFGLGLFATLTFNVVRKNVTVSNIMDLGTEIIKAMAYAPEDDGLYHPGQRELRTAALDISDFDIDMDNLDFVGIVQQLVDENGLEIKVTEDLIADILSDAETKELVDSVMNQTVDYMAGKTDTIELNPDKIESVVTKSIKTIEIKTGTKIDYDPQELKQEISAGIKDVTPALTEALDEAKEEYGNDLQNVIKVLEFFSFKNLMIFCGILIVIAALIFILNMNVFALFRYISIPSIVVGLIYLTLGVLGGAFIVPTIVDVLKNEYEALITPVTVIISLIFKQFLVSGIGSFVPGLALCVIGYVAGAKVKAE